MKKRLLSTLLALCMALALLPTAFAADSEPGITLSIELSAKDRTFTLRDWERSGNDSGTIIKAEAKSVSVSGCSELPLGVTLTINAWPYDGAGVSSSFIEFYAWSDPDGDGVYDMRIALYDGELHEKGLLPVSEGGPVEAEMYTNTFQCVRKDDDSKDPYSQLKGSPVGMWPISTTVQVTSDHLTELFGRNTFLQIAVAAGEGEYGPYYNNHYYLLTGEQAGSDPAEEPTEPENPSTSTFTDVTEGIWYYEAVQWAADNGYIQGYNGKFSPNDALTRGAVFTILARMDNADTEGGSAWYEKGMNWAVENGISDGTNPTSAVTLEMLVTMLYRYENKPDADISVLTRFSDSSSVHTWTDCREAMAWAVEIGLVQGSDGKLDPLSTLARSRGAVVLQRYCNIILGEK